MKPLRFASLVLAFLAAAGPVRAQNSPRPAPAPGQMPVAAPGEIRGTVVDAENNAPIASASVAVWSKADAALVAGAIVHQDGSFRIEGLRPGVYYLKLTMIGYANQTTPDLTITPASPRASLGTLRLTRAAVEVAGIEATAERQLIIAPDRNSYRAKDVAPAAATASDVLDNVPAVSVDADGKVSLRGNENVVIQVNGRPTPIRGSQLAGYLRQMPANTIERIEVIPNPSAKQDPEGMAGIINIVMKQGVDLGTSGALTVLGATNDRYFVSGNLGRQSGPVKLFFTYGFNSDERQFTGANDRTRLQAGTPSSYTFQDLGGQQGNSGHNVSANVDYELNKRDVLSTTLQVNRRNGDDGSLSAYTELDGSQVPTAQYNRLRRTDTDNWLADAALMFKRTITPQRHELSVEARFNHQDDADFTEHWRESVGTAFRSEAEINDIDALTKQFTAQVDYTRGLSDKTKLETGYKGNLRMLDRDYVVEKDPFGSGQYEPTDLSNALELDESVNAVYAVLSHSRKKFEYQAGLRAEYATRDFSLSTTGENFPHDYTSLFPSGLINYKANDKTQIKLSYSRRIRRPGAQELNPFPSYFDLQNVFLGNPQLDPEYTDAIELGFQRSGQLGTLQISPFYRRTSDIIRVEINTADTLNGREVTSISFNNLDHSSSWGADLNGQFKLGKALSGLAAVNVFKMVTDGGSESSLQSNAVSWTFRTNGSLIVTPTTTLMANFFYRAPMNFEQGKFSRFTNANFSVRQKLSGDKLSATLRVSDPFKQNTFNVRVGDDNLIQLTDRSFNARGLHLMMQYNFGQAPRLRQRRQEEQPQSASPFGQ